MPEQKKRGFHALEQRIHELEEEDAKATRSEAAQPREREAAERNAPPASSQPGERRS